MNINRITYFLVLLIKRRVILRRLIQRYLLTFENSKKPCQPHAPQLTSERLGDCSDLKDLIAQLQGMLRRSEERKDPAATKLQSEVSANRETKISSSASGGT